MPLGTSEWSSSRPAPYATPASTTTPPSTRTSLFRPFLGGLIGSGIFARGVGFGAAGVSDASGSAGRSAVCGAGRHGAGPSAETVGMPLTRVSLEVR